MTFNEANETVHPVETQWHYPIMTKYGYVADTKEAVGFVRGYRYTHPDMKHSVVVATGVSSDHWSDEVNKKFGYWGELEAHIAALHSAQLTLYP